MLVRSGTLAHPPPEDLFRAQRADLPNPGALTTGRAKRGLRLGSTVSPESPLKCGSPGGGG